MTSLLTIALLAAVSAKSFAAAAPVLASTAPVALLPPTGSVIDLKSIDDAGKPNIHRYRFFDLAHRPADGPRPSKVHIVQEDQVRLLLNDVAIMVKGQLIKRRRGRLVILRAGDKLGGGALQGPSDMLLFHLKNGQKRPARAPTEGVSFELPSIEGKKTSGTEIVPLNADTPFEASLIILRVPLFWNGPFKKNLVWYAISGAAQVKIGDEIKNLGPDQLAVIPAGSTQSVGLIPGPRPARILQIAAPQ